MGSLFDELKGYNLDYGRMGSGLIFISNIRLIDDDNRRYWYNAGYGGCSLA